MSDSDQYDVIICGGGMTGLALALALVPTGLRLALVDHQPAPPRPDTLQQRMNRPQFDTRVSALTPASRNLLDSLGVWGALQALRVCPYTDMQVWDADGTGEIHFAAAEMHVPCLGYIAENGLVSAVLAAAVASSDNITLFQPDSLEGLHTTLAEAGDTRQILTLRSGTTLGCRLLVGADGGDSRVRALAGFSTRAWNYGHEAIVTTVTTAEPHGFTAWQRFMSTGPLAFLPLQLPGAAAQHHSSIVWSCVPELAAELLALPEEQFARRLEQSFEFRLGRVEQVATRQSFPLRQKHASDYIRPGVALVGDAAHTIHPLAGQGVNLGLADVLSLGGIISRALARNEDFACDQVLSRYQRERKAANLGMMLLMEGFKRAFSSDALSVRWLRNAGLKTAHTLTPFKHMVMSRAMGLK
jgi:2-octaprenylphenol hydroxylase